VRRTVAAGTANAERKRVFGDINGDILNKSWNGFKVLSKWEESIYT